MLELQHICFERQNKKILDDINLKIDTNKFIAITGPNGSGKSTLVKIIMGIEKPDSGKVILDGKDITNLSINERAKLGVGFAFQQPVKFKGITVYDLINLSLGKKVKLDKKSLQAYAFCVCTNCPCPSGTNSYTAKYNDSERKAK